jgi:hypothetical protein
MRWYQRICSLIKISVNLTIDPFSFQRRLLIGQALLRSGVSEAWVFIDGGASDSRKFNRTDANESVDSRYECPRGLSIYVSWYQ